MPPSNTRLRNSRDECFEPTRTAIHGGLEWQGLIAEPSSYEDLICADVNDAWYPPSPSVLETLSRWRETVNHCPDALCRRLRAALSRCFGVEEEQLAAGCGSSALIHSSISALVRDRDCALLQDPTYSEYARSIVACGGRVLRFVLKDDADFATDLSALLEKVTSSTRLVILCNPNNPTGHVLTREELLDFLRLLPERVYVLVDEAYIDYAPSESIFDAVPAFPNLIVVKTFSKAYAMAGLRVGYAAFGEHAKAVYETRVLPPWRVSGLGLAAAEAALGDPSYVRSRVEESLNIKRELAERIGSSAGLRVIPSATHYFMVDLNALALSSADLVRSLREKKVFLRDCGSFGESMGSRYVRLTVQAPQQSSRLADALLEALGANRASPRFVSPHRGSGGLPYGPPA